MAGGGAGATQEERSAADRRSPAHRAPRRSEADADRDVGPGDADEAVDTVKNGGESTASKVDDAVDDLREGAKDAADEIKDK